MKVFILLVFAFAATAAHAQGPTRPTPKAAVLESQRQERDNLLLRKTITGNENDSTRAATLKQINDDFKELQLLNNKLVQTINEPQPDYKIIERTAADLAGRASRLKQNLSLPKGETGSTEKRNVNRFEDEAGIKAGIKLIDERIVRFTTNPLFKAANVVDVDLGKKASRDLDALIELSKQLRKAVSKL